MKSKVIETALLITLVLVVAYIFYDNYRNLKRSKEELQYTKSKLMYMQDSMNKVQYANYYLSTQFELNYSNNKSHDLSNVRVFDLKEGKPEKSKQLNVVTSGAKDKLVIRYSEIGCNSCSDSTIKAIATNSKLRLVYDIVFLVHFTNYDAYLKWKKITGLTDKIYWLNKGELPFELERGQDSYMFTINNKLEASNFFIPNSKMSYFINSYLTRIIHT